MCEAVAWEWLIGSVQTLSPLLELPPDLFRMLTHSRNPESFEPVPPEYRDNRVRPAQLRGRPGASSATPADAFIVDLGNVDACIDPASPRNECCVG